MQIGFVRVMALAAILMSLDLAAPLAQARAELVLSQLIVELSPGNQSRSDLEVLNTGPDRAFVSVEPREILAPGTAMQSRNSEQDPEKLGLLVAPARLILEPRERRLIRIASIAPPSDRERVYRVTIKPVVGQLSSEASGLKVLVGYDVLVLVRPRELKPHVTGTRNGARLSLHNDGNASVELVAGERCQRKGNHCEPLPGTRLYSGATIELQADAEERVLYKGKVENQTMLLEF